VVDPHVCYSAPEAIAMTGLPRAMFYEALESGEIKAVRRGRRWIIGGSALIRFMEEFGQ
jgi:excisionase family DNA binding protein